MIIWLGFAKECRVREDIRMWTASPNNAKMIVLQGILAGNQAILEIRRFFLLSANLFGGPTVLNELNDFI
jgi:hypothetical protein